MKALLIAEYREGKLLNSIYELIAFAEKMGAEPVVFAAGSEAELPQFEGRLYLADSAVCGEYNPLVHKQLLLEVAAKESPDLVVLAHSSYGWDLAPRVALALQAGQISEVIDIVDNQMVVPACNSKLRRNVSVKTGQVVVTLQAGAFTLQAEPAGSPAVVKVAAVSSGNIDFAGYEEAAAGGVDLGKAEVIVSAGRGIGKAENVAVIAELASALGGELGASRPVVDAEWAEHDRQVGTTGQTVSPKLYVACGISGAIQHLAGMKKSEYVVAINTDRDAPISELADVLVVADVKEFVPALTEKIQAR